MQNHLFIFDFLNVFFLECHSEIGSNMLVALSLRAVDSTYL